MVGDDATIFERPVRHWFHRNRYLTEHQRILDGVRLRPTDEPSQTVATPNGPLTFETSACTVSRAEWTRPSAKARWATQSTRYLLCAASPD